VNYDISHFVLDHGYQRPRRARPKFAVLPAGGGHSFDTNYTKQQAQSLASQAEKTFDQAQAAKPL